MANEEMVRKTWELVKEFENNWNQEWFITGEDKMSVKRLRENANICETSMCFAGFAILASGGSVEGGQFRSANGEAVEPDSYAQTQLGLTFAESDEIFYESAEVTDLDEMRKIVETVTGVNLS